ELAVTLKRKRGYRPLLHISWRQVVESNKKSKAVRIYAGKNHSEIFNPEGDARVNIASIIEQEISPSNALQLSLLDTSEQSQVENGSNPFEIQSSDSNPFQKDGIFSVAYEQQQEQKQLSECDQQFQAEQQKRHTDVWQLDGSIKIYVERYLHLNTDLYLRLPAKKEIELGAIETSLAADRLLDSLEQDEDQDTGFGWQFEDDFLQNEHEDTTVIQDVLNRYTMQQSRRMRSNETHYLDHPLFGMLIQIRPYKLEIPES
ncbi:MAG: hypothetical protein DRQ47_05290, partial [Gammaproteobacteria bacterium]